jgi:hypothetical protein
LKIIDIKKLIKEFDKEYRYILILSQIYEFSLFKKL